MNLCVWVANELCIIFFILKLLLCMISSWEKIIFFIDTDKEVNIKHNIIKRRI